MGSPAEAFCSADQCGRPDRTGPPWRHLLSCSDGIRQRPVEAKAGKQILRCALQNIRHLSCPPFSERKQCVTPWLATNKALVLVISPPPEDHYKPRTSPNRQVPRFPSAQNSLTCCDGCPPLPPANAKARWLVQVLRCCALNRVRQAQHRVFITFVRLASAAGLPQHEDKSAPVASVWPAAAARCSARILAACLPTHSLSSASLAGREPYNACMSYYIGLVLICSLRTGLPTI